ncbi:cation transporter [Candidatus Micrarchaeota archaeon]|nr:cation transporter [Candidatus Micrarchaeota archaeon]
MLKNGAEKTGFSAFLLNIFLFALKMAAGIMSGSLAVISDALNSFLDCLSYLLAFLSIRFSGQAPDRDHPFGHRRAEPLSALVVAIFTGILGIEILKSAIMGMMGEDGAIEITEFTFAALGIAILIKIFMHFYLMRSAKENMSSSLEALAIDSRNDVLATSVALLGVASSYAGIAIMDKVAAIGIAFYILRSGYLIAKKNIDYLLGASPDRKMMKELRTAAKSVEGVKGLSVLRAHYVGDRLHVEAGIVLDRKMKTEKTHEIGVRVQKKLEGIRLVSRAFVHIDYE